MNKFLFKSTDADLQKILINKLETIQKEQRHARADLAYLIRHMNELVNNQSLQKQVDQFFEEDKENIPEVEDDRYNRDKDNTESS